MKVREVMTTDVMSVRDDAEVEAAARLLSSNRISGVPVVNAAGSVVGLLTEYDLLTTTAGQTVADVMTRSVISVTPDTEIESVAALLANRRIRRVPVMDGDRLVGIVSRSDIVRQIAMRWVCHVCGENVRSLVHPDRCPTCGAGADAFDQAVPPPGP